MKVHTDGKESLTRFKVLRNFEGYTFIECEPVTGRTHQIRVHAQFAGYSIVGDDKYSPNEANILAKSLGFKRLCLHAARLDIDYEGIKLTLEAPIEDAWKDAMAGLPTKY